MRIGDWFWSIQDLGISKSTMSDFPSRHARIYSTWSVAWTKIQRERGCMGSRDNGLWNGLWLSAIQREYAKVSNSGWYQRQCVNPNFGISTTCECTMSAFDSIHAWQKHEYANQYSWSFQSSLVWRYQLVWVKLSTYRCAFYFEIIRSIFEYWVLLFFNR